ncbi:MAG: fatty acid hydroxylase family protein [Bacteroidetes bacterium]|nr:MAG: fatty acid hydroxylase family protein [Bacteroidota bacterium]
MDWLAAHREHPIDSIYTIAIINLPAFLLGFDLNILAFVVARRAIWALYIHSNVRLPIGKLMMLIGTPELHHWHHDKDRDRGNYGNVSPLMDFIFGTYVCPSKEPEASMCLMLIEKLAGHAPQTLFHCHLRQPDVLPRATLKVLLHLFFYT